MAKKKKYEKPIILDSKPKKESNDIVLEEKYETCIHAEQVGAFAVYVGTGCPRANMIKGVLVSSRSRCRECASWKGRTK